MLYCCEDHRAVHRPIHAKLCHRVKKERERIYYDKTDEDYYTEQVYNLLEVTMVINTFDAVCSALDHAKEIFRVNRGRWNGGEDDFLRLRDTVPALLLRLGRDQECYDFIKWYQTTGRRGDDDWADMSLPFLDIVDANVFESVGYMCDPAVDTHTCPITIRHDCLLSPCMDLEQLSAMALLKIKLLLDVRSLQSLTVIREKVLPEIYYLIQSHIPQSTAILKNKDIKYSMDYTSYIKKLSSQVEMLYTTIEKANKDFWKVLSDPEKHLARGFLIHRWAVYSTLEQMHKVLSSSFNAWIETPGALEVIKAKVERNVAF